MIYMTLYTVGETPRGPMRELVDEYKKFLSRFAKIDHRVVTSIDGILNRLPEGRLIVLEATGKQLTSEKFASYIEGLDSQGEKVTCIIGGPFGIPIDVKQKADLLLSLSPMTTTHDLALILLLEQLFRAFSIIQGNSYHK